MLKANLLAALNQQINEEYYSSYIYQSMVAYFADNHLDGCAHWMRLQAQEEHDHALKIFDYVISRGGRVVLADVKAPPKEWATPQAAFEAALAHEKLMTTNITKLADLAQSEKDHATNNLMQWYVTEQVEEEANVDDILSKLKLVGGDGAGLFLIDRELKTRTAAAPAGGAA
jgi:ferritin